MTGPKSVLSRIIDASAERLAQDPRIPLEARAAFRDSAASVMHGMWAAAFGGEVTWVRIYSPKVSPEERALRQARIVAALRAREAPAVIAKREGVTVRWVQITRRTLCMESSHKT